MLERNAIEKFHDDEGLTVVLSDFMDRTNIRVIKCRCGLGFSLKAIECVRVFGQFIGQKLERDKSVQSYVFSFVDHTHPATAEFLDDAIVRDALAHHSRESYVCKHGQVNEGCGVGGRLGRIAIETSRL